MRSVDWENALKFFAPIERSKRIHKNFVYRFQHLGLPDDIAASSVGVDLQQVYSWDDGEEIPFLVKRVWELESRKFTPNQSDFKGWTFAAGRIVTPEGARYTERQLRHALFLFDQLP